ncbi:M50 family metallopeptidase [Arcanobacterium phocae]|uniref:M50 family metallopeptidase n=1 Tax=Arcanobacterium phocae TaxID=131112 RepID=UPI001C0F0CF8|nr:site-2 protease family protein [Arcanobacterium phocae]
MLPGIIFMVIGLVASVAIHELGHLIPAKKFGAKVSRYFVGFGPTVWSIERGGTEWGFKAIPLGGFVSIAGMLPPAKGGVPTTKTDGSLTLAQEARLQSAEEFDDPAQPGAFWHLPARLKMIVMFGGPLTNLIISIVLLAAVTVGIGVPRLSTTIAQVAPCIDNAETCTPAPATGVIEPSDTIISWGGKQVETWNDIQQAIATGGAVATDVVVERNNVQKTLSVTPVMREFDDGTGTVATKPYVGIGPAIERRPGTLSEVPGQTWTMASGTAKILVQLPVKLWDAASTLVTGEKRTPDSVVGLVGIADVAGSISAAQVDNYGFLDRLGDLTMLLAGLNMTLFIFNMIPLLPLDGGHILGALIEGVRRKIAFSQGKPDPGPFDTARLLPVSYAMILFFVFMTVLLIVVDIVNPIV